MLDGKNEYFSYKMWEGSDIIFPDRVGSFFVYTTWKLGSSLSCKLPIYIYIYIYVCEGQRGEVDMVASQIMLAISYIKAHGKQCSEENAGKYERNDDTRLYCSTSRGSAPALHTHRFCAAQAPLTLAVWNGRYTWRVRRCTILWNNRGRRGVIFLKTIGNHRWEVICRCCAKLWPLPDYYPPSIGRFRVRGGGGVRIRGGIRIRQSDSDFNERG